jgi:undecaprenyl-diphosphatase
MVAAGGAVLAVTTRQARARVLHPHESTVFRAINGLPGTLLVPVFVAMQAGSLAAVFVAAGIAWRYRGRRTAVDVFAAGFSAWVGAKLVKRTVQRGRPSVHYTDVLVRGPAERGLGFPSGHSAVAFAMASTVAPRVRPRWALAFWKIAAIVGISRVYVGAHLPLDVVGGAGLGLAIGATVRSLPHR